VEDFFGTKYGVLMVDEVHRFVRPWDDVSANPVLDVFDISRNFGRSWVAATKQAALLPPLITTLSSHMLVTPTKTPAVRKWYRAAGLDDVLEMDVPEHWWIHIEETGQRFIRSTEEALARLLPLF
jgi:hypothetical protein